MDGAHDMGGIQGFGPVKPAKAEPVFAAAWEGRVFALTLAMGKAGRWNIDSARFAREDRSPFDYLEKSYFELWLVGIERLLTESGLLNAEELKSGRIRSIDEGVPVLRADEVAGVLSRGGRTFRATNDAPRFKVGDRVRARVMFPKGHTRLPRYVRGRSGVVELSHGAHVFADAHAAGKGECAEWLYTVSFDGNELWGSENSSNMAISVDAWESYLDPV